MKDDAYKDLVAETAATPSHNGDGYGYGGAAVLIIGGRAILLGERDHDLALAIAARWNCHVGQTVRPDLDDTAF